MNRKWYGLLQVLALVALAALPLPAVAEGPGSRISLSGSFLIFEGSLPAVWHFDPEQKKILIDIEVAEGVRSWALLDWSGPSPAGYIGREDGCFSFPLSQAAPPTPEAFAGLLRSPGYAADAVGPDEIASGLTSVRDTGDGTTYLVVKEEGALVVFTPAANAAAPAPAGPASLAKDVSACQPITRLTEALGAAAPKADAAPEAASPAAAESPLLQYNLPYTFRGLLYGHLKYAGTYFSQTKPQYDTALQECHNAGTGKCKPYYETGGWFGRYGYHCGDGWGGGYDDRVSGMDACCLLHDRQSWGSNQLENLCGFAACMTCKHYGNLGDWEQNFRGDFWAQKAIAVFVGTGIAAAFCHPQNHLTGFTCD
jgi:hypothetical protein